MTDRKSDGQLERVLSAGEFAVSGEMGPGRAADADSVRRHAETFRGRVDAVNFTDNQSAIVRMSSIGSGVLAMREGLEPVLQITCRDRNRLAVQADVLGAAALGFHNVLCLSGDHQRQGSQPGAKNVYDIDSIQLIHTIVRMRDEGVFLSGEALEGARPRLFVGAAANPFADPFEYRPTRLAKKVKAGADFIQTQAVYDIGRFRRWMQAVCDRYLHEQVHILAGVLPSKSAGALRYMRNNIAGMRIPDELITRMAQAEDRREEGLRICVELIEQIREIDGVRGVHVMPVMWESVLPTVVERAGLLPRPESR